MRVLAVLYKLYPVAALLESGHINFSKWDNVLGEVYLQYTLQCFILSSIFLYLVTGISPSTCSGFLPIISPTP